MKRVMGLWDIVFINITAVIAIRWLPIIAAFGASSILLWILAALLFFIPLGLVSTELATTWPDQGGMYVWVREAFGKRTGFMISWLYWVNNFFYCPAVLVFVAVTIAFVINPDLEHNKLFIYSLILGFLWLVTLINIHGMKTFKRFSDVAGIFGTLLPGIILIVLGFSAVLFWKRPIVTDYSWGKLLPDFGSNVGLAGLSLIMFSMVGIELTPIMAGETKNPQKTFPRATLISAILIVGLYILMTVAITFVLVPEHIDSVSGIQSTMYFLTKELHVSFLASIVALMLVLGNIGAMGIWSVASIKMLLESCKDGLLPKWFTQTNKADMPARALLIQTLIITFIIICIAVFSPSVSAFFVTTALITVITNSIPYGIMFLAFIKLRKKYPEKFRPYRVPGGNLASYLVAMIGFFSVLLAIVIPFIEPPKDLQSAHDKLLYYIEIGSSTVIFAMVGYFIYALFKSRQKRARIQTLK